MEIHGMLRKTHVNLGTYLIVWFWWFLVIVVAARQRTDPIEVNALLSVRRSLIDPFHNLDRWSRGDPCTSDWTGVICYNGTFEDGNLHVSELLLLNRNLSGSLSPELGRLSYLTTLDFMWNNITGTIPREIGNITTLELLLLNGNQLIGSLPEELGNLFNLDRIQIDQNQISGPIPLSFANLGKLKHVHMNNNSLSGQIPPELSRLPNLVHLLLDNNNLSGYLPSELSQAPSLQIIQLDNNNFGGSTIPSSYGNMSNLLKLSLRNCSLQGSIRDWSNLTSITYLDLSLNQLSGSIPTAPLGENITTINLSSNNLNGTIPASFINLPRFQKLSVANNTLSGSISSIIWLSRTLNSTDRLILDFKNNMFSSISGSFFVPPNVTVGLQGNPLCSNNNLVQLCGSHADEFDNSLNTVATPSSCQPQSCPHPYEYAPASSILCFCAAPLLVGYRLKSPGFSDFLPYVNDFRHFLSSSLHLNFSQIEIDSVAWQWGPRLRMYLKIFPAYDNKNTDPLFTQSDVIRIRDLFIWWAIPLSPIFGPFELLNFTIPDAYSNEFPTSTPSGMSNGELASIVVGAIAGIVAISAIFALLVLRFYIRKHPSPSKRRQSSRVPMKIDGVKDFSYHEMALATNNFSSSSVIGQGGYGKVYKGVLADGTVVAIKCAQEGSLQGETEFLTEIELLSRLHHRNLVSLIGYCDEKGAQMLIYEFMPNGTLRDNLSVEKSEVAPNFAMRVRIALGSAKGILYLHTEANPPIFHRDIKASNILLDSKLTPKVADFGLSKLAPVHDLEGDMPAHVSTVVKGTPGYLDPEYMLTRKLTDKSDVYSLGVVFLELLTGMYPISRGKNIVREVNNAYHSGMIFSIVDEQMGSYPSECIEKFINLALKCCLDDTNARPSMAQVVRELENIWLMMPESDTKMTESSVSTCYSGKGMAPPLSSSSSRNPYLSQDLSGCERTSGIITAIEPR